MDEITINRSTESVIEFDMTIEGASSDDAEVLFVIHLDQFKISFPCYKESHNTFKSTIPAVPFLDIGINDCSVEVIINGQRFEPFKSSISVMDKVNITVSPIHKQEDNEETIKLDPVVTKDVADGSSLISRVMFRNKVEETEKDRQVRDILKDLNIDVKPTKRSKTPSLKRITERQRLTK